MKDDREEFSTSKSRSSDKRGQGSRKSNGRSRSKNGANGKRSTGAAMGSSSFQAFPTTTGRALVAGSGTFSFNQPLGSAIVDGAVNWYTSPGNWATMPKFIPGVASFGYSLEPGIATDALSPINVAGRALFDFVNSKNSRNLTYNMPDLVIAMYAIADAYRHNMYMEQVLSAAKLYSVYNRYMPKTILMALGVNPDSILENMADFQFEINRTRRLCNALCLPAGYPLFSRMSALSQALYADSQSSRAQIYVFRPMTFGIYDEVVNAQGGSVVMNRYYDQQGQFISNMPPMTINQGSGVWSEFKLLNYEDLIGIADAQLDALLNSQDINMISTDILKAYEGNIIQLLPIEEQNMLPIVYSEDILLSIKNASISMDIEVPSDDPNWTGAPGSYVAGTAGILTQDVNSLILNNLVTTIWHGGAGALYRSHLPLVFAHEDDPSAERVLQMMRFKYVGSGSYSGGVTSDVVLETCPTEVLSRAYLFVGNPQIGSGIQYLDSGYCMPYQSLNVMPSTSAISQANTWLYLNAAHLMSTFHEGPETHIVLDTVNDTDTSINQNSQDWRIGDIYLSTSIPVNDIKRINETDILISNGLT